MLTKDQIIQKLRDAMIGWDAYGWKKGEYIDSIQDYFDNVLNEIEDNVDDEESENKTHS